ncbi:MAG TPA: ADOP family duplicated permease [Bryobacteraceae bacterium]|jgi:predicted permease|nr:ADOP family duplicated permease [Bryobacteraceae bacterium]
MRAFIRKLNWLLARRRKEAELREELAFHLEEEAEELAERGLGVAEARNAARRDFGNSGLVAEDTRAAWGWRWTEELAQDVRYAMRAMRASRTFTALALVSLALGIGANTAIFSFLDAILLRRLPAADPESLVLLRMHMRQSEVHGMEYHDGSFKTAGGGFTNATFAYPAFELFRNSGVFASVFCYQSAGGLNVSIGGDARIADGEYVSGEYFHGLGIRAASGRLLEEADDRAGAAPVVVAGFGFANARLGGVATVVGRQIRIDGIVFTVVGVAPAEFFGADPAAAPELYVPMHANLLLDAQNSYSPPAGRYADPNVEWLNVMARLRPGGTPAQAQAVLSGPFSEWMRTVNTRRNRANLPTLLVEPGAGGLDGLRREYRKPLALLLGVTGLILVLACANIANLLLARAAARRREMAIRLSVGAGRRRVIRQLLTESVLLALAGSAAGIGLAIWGMRSITALLADGREGFTLHAALNWHVLAAAAALAVVTGVFFGLAPALEATRVDLVTALKQSRTGGAAGHSRFGLGRALMVAQMGIALLVLVLAGLMVRTLGNLESVRLGFDREHVLTFHLNPAQTGHKGAEMTAFYEELRRRLAELPGVQAASLSVLPMIGSGQAMTMVSTGKEEAKATLIQTVGPDFFRTMQIPILLGRGIEDRDRAGAPYTAVVSDGFAREHFGQRNPVGEHLRFSECERCEIEIVGVAANARYGSLRDEAGPVVYLPYGQAAFGPVEAMYYELRTAGNPLAYEREAREIVRRADPGLPVADVRTQTARIDGTIRQSITFARLCAAFALLALAIACVGLYGTVAYRVARRTGEIEHPHGAGRAARAGCLHGAA